MEKIIVNNVDITKFVTSFEMYEEMDTDTIIGSTISTQVKLKLNNKDGQLTELLDYPFFIGNKTYIIYEKPSRWTQSISLVLYDQMILTNIPYETELPEKTTIEAQLEEMSQLVGIEIDKSTLSQDVLNRQVDWQDKTMVIRTYLGYIAQCDGKNAYVENDKIVFRVLCEDTHNIDFCSNYEINELIIITRVYYNNGTVIYSRGNKSNNTLYLDSNNRYVNESDVERIFSLYDHLSFYSFRNFKCRKTQDIKLTNLITYNGMTFMPISIKRKINGGEAKDSLELSGDIQIKNAEDVTISTNPNEEIKKIIIDQIDATRGEFERIDTEFIKVNQQLEANRADINILNASVAKIEEAYISKAQVEQLYATKAEVGTISANVAEIQEAMIGVAYVDDLNALEAKINEIEAGSITTDYLETNYAKIDLSNIENGCITTAMIQTGAIGTAQIADGSITDAKIVGLTANKITAGTIDASDIEVINLNCANLTVGTINGQQISSGAIDWDKLSSQVSGSITEAGDNANQALEDALEAFQKAQEALNSANSAQTTANGKNTVFYQSAQPAVSGRKVNDIWYDTDDGYKMYYFNGTSWQAVEFGENAIADDAISADKIASDVNSKINDAFTNAGIAISDSSNALSKANTAIADSATALSTANSAKSTADGKNSVFYQTSAPSTSNRKVNDVWFDTDDSNKMYYWNGSAWTARQFGTNAIANLAITNALIADGTIQNAKIANLDAAKITSGYINVARLQAGSITADKLKADTITAASGVIADAAILTANIADLAVSSGKIANAAIGTAKIADLAVTNAKLANLSVTNAKIADATIQSAKIASLDAGKITSGYISSDRIQAGSLVIGKLDSSTQNTINNAYSTANNAVLTTAMASGKMLFTDPSFASGNNALSVYNNSVNGTVTMKRISRPSDSPITSSGYVLEIKNTGTSTPNCGGFMWGHGSRANAIFIYKIIAKIPNGRMLSWHSNSVGTGSTQKWITNPTGDGNTYKEYICYLHCGYTGNFSATGHFALTGSYGSTSSPVTWYVAYATCFDCTNVNLDYNSIISNWCYNNDETYINGGKIYTGTVTASQIAANAIVAGKIAANAVTTGTIAADAVTSAKIAADAITAEHVAANAITTDNIVAGAVTGAKIAASTITANNIAANTITAEKIASGTITATQIASGTITATQLASNSVTAVKIAANAITSDKIAANAITSAKIATDAIKSRNYVANSVGSYLNLQDGSFSSKNLKWTSDGTLTAVNGNFTGTINATGGKIANFTIDSEYIQNSSKTIGFGTSANWAFWAGGNTLETVKFRVDSSGNLYAISANISGTINATSGKISGFTIDETYIQDSDKSVGFGTNEEWAFWAGGNSKDTAKFRVDKLGNLYATAGYIAGFTISNSYIRSSDRVVGIGNDDYWTFYAGYDPSTGKARFRIDKEGYLYFNYLENTNAPEVWFGPSIDVTVSDSIGADLVVGNTVLSSSLEVRGNIRFKGNIRATNSGSISVNKGYFSGNVSVGSFTNRSSEKYKTNIQVCDRECLDIIYSSKIYSYNLIEDIKNNVSRTKYGFIIERETPNEIISNDGEGIDIYSALSLNWKATQDLYKIILKFKNENAQLKQELKNTQDKLDAFINNNFQVREVAA